MANKIVQAIYDLKDNVSSGLKRIGAAWKGAEKDADHASTSIDKSTGRLSKSFALAADGVGKLRSALVAVGAAVGLVKIKDGIVGILETGERLGDLRKQLDTAFGGVEAGGVALEKLRELAANVPDGFENVAAAAIKLRQAGLDPLDGSLQALIDNNVALDGSQEKLLRTIDLLGKANLKGEAGMRALVALTQEGIPAFDLLAKATGRSVEEVKQLAKDGKLGSDAIRALVQEVGKLRAGAAASEMGDLAAQVQKVKDSINGFLAEIADAGALEFFQQRMAALVARIKELSATGELQAAAKRISDGIIAVGKAVEGTLTFIVRYSSELLLLAKAYAAVKVVSFVAGMAASAKAMFEAGVAAQAAAVKVGGLRGALMSVPSAIKIGVAVIGLDLAIGQWQKFFEQLEEGRAIEEEASRIAQATTELRIKQAAKLKEIIRIFEGYSTVTIRTTAELKEATETELKEYEKRLEGARKYFAALAVERSRANDPAGAEAARASVQRFGEAIDVVRQRFKEMADARDLAFAAPPENKLQEALLALGVNAELAGVKISEAGAKAIGFLKDVVRDAQATAEQISAAFSKALEVANTTAEVQRLREALAEAFQTGKIGFAEWSILFNESTIKLQGIEQAAHKVGGAMGQIGEAGRLAAQRALVELEKLRDTAVRVAQETAEKLAAAIRRNDDPTVVDQLAESARKADKDLQDLNARVADLKGKVADATETGKKGLQEMGRSGQQAGEDIAIGAQKAEAALRNAEAAAEDTRHAAEELGDANDDTAAGFVGLTGAASDLASALGDVSDAFRQAAEAQTGRRTSGGGKESGIFSELRRQREELEEQVRQVRDLNAGFDETEQRVRALRGQFQFLGDDSLRELAQAQQQLAENQRRAAEERQRELERAAEKAAANATARRERSAADGGGASTGGITVNVSPTIIGDRLPDSVLRGWGAQIGREIEQQQRRRR